VAREVRRWNLGRLKAETDPLTTVGMPGAGDITPTAGRSTLGVFSILLNRTNATRRAEARKQSPKSTTRVTRT